MKTKQLCSTQDHFTYAYNNLPKSWREWENVYNFKQFYCFFPRPDFLKSYIQKNWLFTWIHKLSLFQTVITTADVKIKSVLIFWEYMLQKYQLWIPYSLKIFTSEKSTLYFASCCSHLKTSSMNLCPHINC